MVSTIPGLHHVTATSGPPQANDDFYAGLLRQRPMKKSVNFDAPDTCHLYCGDRAGSPGAILTLFPFADAGPGRAGPGMAGAVAYAVPKRGLDAWMERLAEQAADFDTPGARFGEPMIAVRDPDNLPIELIETPPAAPGNGGATDGVPADDESHSVTLWLRDPGPTARPLTELSGYGRAGEEPDGNCCRHRLAAPGRGRGSMIDLLRSEAPNIGRQGATTSSIIRHRITFPAYNPQPGT